MIWFMVGAYACGVVFTFCVVGFCVMLGGDNRELWRPFAYAVLWPVALPWVLMPLVVGWWTNRRRRS